MKLAALSQVLGVQPGMGSGLLRVALACLLPAKVRKRHAIERGIIPAGNDDGVSCGGALCARQSEQPLHTSGASVAEAFAERLITHETLANQGDG